MKLSFEIKKSLDTVWDYLTDMQKFVAVHPVITRMEEKERECFRVYETLKFVGISISFTYSVAIESKQMDNKIIMNANVGKRTKVQMVFILKPENDHTVIEENISLQSPLPVKSIVLRIFKQQHAQLFKNIEMEL